MSVTSPKGVREPSGILANKGNISKKKTTQKLLGILERHLHFPSSMNNNKQAQTCWVKATAQKATLREAVELPLPLPEASAVYLERQLTARANKAVARLLPSSPGTSHIALAVLFSLDFLIHKYRH